MFEKGESHMRRVAYSLFFGNAPKAFNASTTSDPSVDSGEYRKVASQDYILLNLAYRFS